MCSFKPECEFIIAYAAPGTAALCAELLLGTGNGLVDVLGKTRALVMQSVAIPATTSDVAQHLAMSHSLASHHLKALAKQGLVDGVRLGRRVYYEQTARGKRLRAALEE